MLTTELERLTTYMESDHDQGPLWVHHLDCSKEPEYELLRCNCDRIFGTPHCRLYSNAQPLAMPVYAFVWAYTIMPPVACTYTYYQPLNDPAIANPTTALGTAFSSLSLDECALQHPTYSSDAAVYAETPETAAPSLYRPNQFPLCASNGVLEVEQFGNHIANLPYDASTEDTADGRGISVRPDRNAAPMPSSRDPAIVDSSTVYVLARSRQTKDLKSRLT